MRNGISITLSRRDRHQLEAIASDRNTPHKHVWWARIVLMSAVVLDNDAAHKRVKNARLARSAPALDLPLHADVVV